MLLDNENINTYFPNVNKHEQLVMMVVKGEDVLNKLTKMGVLDNKYIYVPKTLEETKEQYNKIFNQKQKRI